MIGNNANVRQPFQRVVGQPPPQGGGQSMYQSPCPAQPATRPVRPQGDPGMHPGESFIVKCIRKGYLSPFIFDRE